MLFMITLLLIINARKEFLLINVIISVFGNIQATTLSLLVNIYLKNRLLTIMTNENVTINRLIKR
jgi:hypothetical protein